MAVETTAAPEAPAPKSTENQPEPKATEKPAEAPKSKYAQKQDAKADAAKSLKQMLAQRLAAEDADEAPAKPAEKKPEPKAEKPKAAEPAKKSASETKSSAEAEKLADKIEDAGGEAPDQKANETDKQYELRLSKTLRDLRDAKAEALKARKEAETSTAELKKLQKLIEGGKANPLTILEHLGVTYEDLTKGIVEEKYKPANKRNDLPPEVLEKIERLEAAEKEREAEKVRAQAEAKRAADVKVVEEYLVKHADDYPLASSASWAARDIVARTYAEDLDGDGALRALKELEANLAENVSGMLNSDRATKALLKKNPKLKELLVKELGLEAPKADEEPEEETPKTVAAADTGAAAKKLTKAELKARAVAELRLRRREREDD